MSMKIQLNEYVQGHRKAIISELAGPSQNTVDVYLAGYIIECYVNNVLTYQMMISSLPEAEKLAENYVSNGLEPKFLRD